MLAYKNIIKRVAETERNFFICGSTKPIKKRKYGRARKQIIVKQKEKIEESKVKWNIRLLFQMLTSQIKNNKQKYKCLYELLQNFLIENNKEDQLVFRETFFKIQRIYYVLNRFAYKWKFKKAKIIVNTDMCLNELTEGNTNVISIIQDKSKYLFNIRDLINIVETALTSSNNFFIQPKCVKNPYNNVPFNKSTLYNIYFFVKFNTHYYSELFYKYFNCDFNLTTFKHSHEYILREKVISTYVYKSAANILYDEIIYMIDEFNDMISGIHSMNKLLIDKNFPKDKLIKIMQPYLYLFIKALYSYHPTDKRNFTFYFKQGMMRFYKFNPHFGKQECKLVNKTNNNLVTSFVCEKFFNDKHIPFYNIEKQNAIFLTDHLNCEHIEIQTILGRQVHITYHNDNDNNNNDNNDNNNTQVAEEDNDSDS